jgi:RHS repeat-associated protein
VGNRITETAGAAVTHYTYSANRLMTAMGGKTFAFIYDNNGNAVTEDQRQYVYNQNQRLIKALDNATVLGQYVYDGKGQRAKKTVNGQTTLYHYDLEGYLIAESTASGAITGTHVYFQGQPIAKIESNALSFYLNDHLGTPMMMTDQNRNIVWQAEHLPFGEPLFMTGTTTNNLRFPGQYYDAETGLHYNYFRDYMPEIGRYIEKDPIGLEGGVNYYAYVENNPVKHIDPYGLLNIKPALPGLCLLGYCIFTDAAFRGRQFCDALRENQCGLLYRFH